MWPVFTTDLCSGPFNRAFYYESLVQHVLDPKAIYSCMFLSKNPFYSNISQISRRCPLDIHIAKDQVLFVRPHFSASASLCDVPGTVVIASLNTGPGWLMHKKNTAMTISTPSRPMNNPSSVIRSEFRYPLLNS